MNPSLKKNKKGTVSFCFVLESSQTLGFVHFGLSFVSYKCWLNACWFHAPFWGAAGGWQQRGALLLPLLGEFTFCSPQRLWLGGARQETHKLAETAGWVSNAARGWPTPFTKKNSSLGERNEDIPTLSGSGKRSPERAVREGQREDEPSITMVEIVECNKEQGRAEKVAKAPGEGEQRAERKVYGEKDIQTVFFRSTEITLKTLGSCGIPDKYSCRACG